MPNNLAQLFIREPGQTRETEIKTRAKTADIKPGTFLDLKRRAGKLQVIDKDGRLIGEIIEEPIKTKTIKILKARKEVTAIVQSAKRGRVKLVLRAGGPFFGNHEIEYKPYFKKEINNEAELQIPDIEEEDEVVEPEEKSPTGDLTITEVGETDSETEDEDVDEED